MGYPQLTLPESRVQRQVSHPIDDELNPYTDKKKSHEAGEAVDAVYTKQPAHGSGASQNKPGDDRRQENRQYHACKRKDLVYSMAYIDRGRHRDHDGKRSGPAQARHGKGAERDVKLFLRLFPPFVRELPFVGEQHAEPEETDDHAPRNADPRDRDPERYHDEVPANEKHNQDCRHVHAGPGDLAVTLLPAQVRADTQEKHRRTDGIDDGEERNKRYANPRKELCNRSHTPEWNGEQWAQYTPRRAVCQFTLSPGNCTERTKLNLLKQHRDFRFTPRLFDR